MISIAPESVAGLISYVLRQPVKESIEKGESKQVSWSQQLDDEQHAVHSSPCSIVLRWTEPFPPTA
jgi:hypothetical protein